MQNAELENIQRLLEKQEYIADRSIVMSVYLAMTLRKPLLVEGPAGVGKTEIAKVLAQALETDLIRLQCYEGLDVNSALYEWNYSRQLLWIRMNENKGLDPAELETEVFGREFLLERPLLSALTKEKSPVLLIDEVDRADQEFEAFLLEVLSEFQVTIPELGTIRAENKPLVILTSNRSRDLSDALRRRCLYLWIDFPELHKELKIVKKRIDDMPEDLALQICRFVRASREEDLQKVPGVSETLDWATAMMALHIKSLEPEVVLSTLGTFLKSSDDLEKFRISTIERIIQSIG